MNVPGAQNLQRDLTHLSGELNNSEKQVPIRRRRTVHQFQCYMLHEEISHVLLWVTKELVHFVLLLVFFFFFCFRLKREIDRKKWKSHKRFGAFLWPSLWPDTFTANDLEKWDVTCWRNSLWSKETNRPSSSSTPLIYDNASLSQCKVLWAIANVHRDDVKNELHHIQQSVMKLFLLCHVPPPSSHHSFHVRENYLSSREDHSSH